jgi:hypothetical protein
MNTTVALFIFNRPETTRAVMAALQAVKPRKLCVIADGPRATHAADATACEEARRIATDVTWPCEVRTSFAPANLGLNDRMASGLDWVFSLTDRAIVLEDDCVPDASFFPYCEDLLARHADEPRVHMIGGSTFTPERRFTADSYYFSRFYHVWGWATWSRAWATYDPQMKDWPQLRDTGWLERLLPAPPMAAAARKVFDESHSRRLFVWDHAWVYSGWKRGACSTVPATNLVSNIGFGFGATHTGQADHPLSRLPTAPLQLPLRHPGRIAVHEAADACEWSYLNPGQLRTGLWQRWLEFFASRRYWAAA